MSIFSDTTKKMMKAMDIKNIHAVPRITKVIVSVGVGKLRDVKGHIEAVEKDLALITGQKPQQRLARKAVAGFAVRAGNIVGYKATLRGKRMEDFVERFVNITLPRVRDFRGLSLKGLDGQGNLSVGVSEHLAFPEIHPDKTDIIFGVEATFVTSATSDAQAEQLFRALGFPFKSTEQMEEEDVQVETAGSRAAKAQQRLAAQKTTTPVAE
ncbi:MAG: 50S ribosomal protein L5 [Candidatus Andersenbacteria bacterium]|nr:50S ribosomal protein L5 [Candidatus Andersenbacteria bacterium]